MKRSPLLPLVLVLAATTLVVGCPSAKAPDGSAASASAPASSSAPASAAASATEPTAATASASASASASAPVLASLPIGAPAPDFALPDLDGKTVRLADYKGKLVVLEWFNPGCPFIKVAHEKRALSKLVAKYAAKGVVFLAINSGAPGKQGNALEENVTAKKTFGITYPILRDPSGEVGKKYGASNTPHLFVIGKDGALAYAGGLDDTRGGEVDAGEKVTPWLADALDAILAGKRPDPAQTKAWGCRVKYAD